MGKRSGVGLVEVTILEALDARRAWPGRRATSCRKVLATLDDELGLAPGYTYQVLIDLALPWQIPVPLVEPWGNFGSQDGFPAASPPYTGARLSPAGQVALAAERGQIAPVPIGLINGNTHRQGTRPPFRPAAVIDAIRQVLARPGLPTAQIIDLVGAPDFVTGCTVTGEVSALAAGQRTELGLQARVTVTDAAEVATRVARAAIRGYEPPGFTRDPARPVIIVDNFPPYVSTSDVAVSIGKRAREYHAQTGHPELNALTGLPLADLHDLSTSGDCWLVCLPASGTPAEAVREQLLTVHGVTIYVPVGLPRPLPTMIRSWVRAHRDEDLTASLTALEDALASPLQHHLGGCG
jgi:hypothetical protein